LLNEVIIQQSVFELIHRAACLCREFFEPDPHQKSTADMIALDACFAALAAFQPGHLFPFTVQANTVGTAVLVAASKSFVSSDTTTTAANTLRILNGSAADDGDGLTNSDELARGTDPLNPDIDGDGVGDGDEIALGTNPLNPNDRPVTQAQSATAAYLNTFVADTDGDSFADVDIA